MKVCIFSPGPPPQREKLGGFSVANFLSYFPKEKLGPATTQNLVVKFDGELCGGVLVENASDDFPSKRSSKISFQTSPEVRHQFRRKLRQLHSGNRWCLKNGLKFVTPQTSENFTAFSTARKEIYHLELALGATSRNLLIRIRFAFDTANAEKDH